MRTGPRKSSPTTRPASSCPWTTRALPLRALSTWCSTPNCARRWARSGASTCCSITHGTTVSTLCWRRTKKRYAWRIPARAPTRHEFVDAAGGGQLLYHPFARIPELLRARGGQPGRQAGYRLRHPECHHHRDAVLLPGADAHAGLPDRPQLAARTVSIHGAGGPGRRHRAVVAGLFAAPPLDGAADQFH